MIALYAMVLGLFAWQVGQGHLALVDVRAAALVAALRSPGLDGPVRLLTFFGSSAWSGLALAGLSGWAWRRGKRPEVRILAATFALGFAVEAALRLLVVHWRPDALTIPASMDLMTRFHLTGFPSGHAFRSAFLFGWLSQALGRARMGRWGRWMCLAMIGVVGLTRVYLNRHWMSDVLGGWLVASVALLIALVWKRSSAAEAA